jgi:hypothetical protein
MYLHFMRFCIDSFTRIKINSFLLVWLLQPGKNSSEVNNNNDDNNNEDISGNLLPKFRNKHSAYLQVYWPNFQWSNI